MSEISSLVTWTERGADGLDSWPRSLSEFVRPVASNREENVSAFPRRRAWRRTSTSQAELHSSVLVGLFHFPTTGKIVNVKLEVVDE